MNAQRSSPIAINRGVTHRRVRRDTIDSIKDSPSTSNQSEKAELPGLGASTPPSFVPDGTYKHNRVDKYDILEQVEGLNKGNVFKAKNVHNDTEYICKVYNRAEYGKAISVYSRLSDEHPNINCIVDKVVEQTKVYAFYNPGQPMMNQEKSKGFCADNIHNFIRNKRRLPEEVAAPLFKQVVAAIEHCHDNNIVLKDLKLRNFIFQDEERTQVMLECLDDAHVLEDGDNDKIPEEGFTFPAYVSPEMIVYLRNSRSKEKEFSGRSRDLWRLGVMLYTMLVGCYPFRTQDEKVLTKIYQCNYTIPNTVSVAAADLIKQLLKRIPHQRTPIKYIQKHPWLLEGGKVPEPVQGLGSGGDSSVVDEDERDYARNFNPLLEASLSKNRFYSDQAVPDSCVPDSDISNDDDDDDEYSVLS